MKKFLVVLLCVLIACASFFTFSACAPNSPPNGDSESDWLGGYY